MQPESSPSWPRGFWNLMFTQFQGAFSDNALRWLVIFPGAGLGEPERSRQGQLRLARLAAVCGAVPVIFHRRRLDGGPLQQTLGDDRGEARGNRHHALRRAGLGAGKSSAPAGRHLPDGNSQHVFRPGEIRRHARGAARRPTLGGQRHPRVAHLHRHHPRHLRRRLAGGNPGASRSMVGSHSGNSGDRRLHHQSMASSKSRPPIPAENSIKHPRAKSGATCAS